MTKFENINVLVGKNDAIEGAKGEIEKFLGDFKGTFKTDWKVQSMQ